MTQRHGDIAISSYQSVGELRRKLKVPGWDCTTRRYNVPGNLQVIGRSGSGVLLIYHPDTGFCCAPWWEDITLDKESTYWSPTIEAAITHWELTR